MNSSQLCSALDRMKLTDKTKTAPEPGLTEGMHRLVARISDIKAMEHQLKQMKFDLDEMPISDIRKKFVTKSYQLLRKIEDLILENSSKDALITAHKEYYNFVPHIGPLRMLENRQGIMQEANLVKALYVGMLMYDDYIKNSLSSSLRAYQLMQCEIREVPISSHPWILKSLEQTHGPTHDFTLKFKTLYSIEKDENFIPELKNNRMLWHGSKTCSYNAILKCSLKKPPKQAPVSGHLFGKGIYFADCSTKAAQYCCCKRGETGYLMICQVALGKAHRMAEGDYDATNLPPGCHSVKGLGRRRATVWKAVKRNKRRVLVPFNNKPKVIADGDLEYHEYVVYDRRQVKMRFLVEVEFC
ncbi:unnamed protein product [Bursaphelenchus xylophilus]|uniref:Poly [ADP-ribose] polymerase n=1 Tax=Bursaphelenchus xylophilus TaxID=6326 RepID=A0A1I7SLQ2_BURXY|nr:unnamed protein product [Bursaphelenchus xylophilus]CAG9129700.1 unnamed protein product [Bursaphelenchus xylophilus]